MAKLDKTTLKTAVDSALTQAGDELNATAARMAHEKRRDKLAFELMTQSRVRDDKGNRTILSLSEAKALADKQLANSAPVATQPVPLPPAKPAAPSTP